MDTLDTLSRFIDNLIKLKFDSLEIDRFIKKKKLNYSLTIKTGKTYSVPSSYGFNMDSDVTIYLSICDDGDIYLSKDEHRTFKETNLEFTKKYIHILEEAYNTQQSNILNGIVKTSYVDLEILRDVNINSIIS